VLDFYAPECKLAVEVDGDSHFQPEAVEYDKGRTEHVAGFGIEVVRVTNGDVMESLEGVLETITAAVRRRQTSPCPLLGKEGRSRNTSAVPDEIGIGERAGRSRRIEDEEPPMRLHIDEEADALHLRLADVPVVESEEVAPGVIVDYDAADQVVGIEVLYLSKRPQPVNLLDFQFQTSPKKSAAVAS